MTGQNLLKINGMNTSRNKYDAIEKIIFENELRIVNIEIRSEIDKMLVFLNTQHILAIPLSNFKTLKKAGNKDLNKFELIANGTGVRWPRLDEDLSLKGFLKDALQQMVREKQYVID